MEIYLIRHTTPNVEKGVCYGHSEIMLTSGFEVEANRVLEKIPQIAKVIYTSPLFRCKALADFLSRSVGLPVVQDSRLKELNFGDWEMKRWDDIDQTPLLNWMNNYETERCPNGESYTDLAARVEDFIEEIIEKDYPVLVVTHAGVAKAFHALINKVSLQVAMDLKIGYGEMVMMNALKLTKSI